MSGFTGTSATVHTSEVVSVVLYVVVLVWVLRQRRPVFLGAFVGATGVFGFDWMWGQSSFFEVTFNSHLVNIPGIAVMGQHEPILPALNYAFGFGFPAILFAKNDDRLAARFGWWRFPGIWLAGVVGVGVYEIPVVHLLGLWTYHQRSAFLVDGFPWSNFWFGGNLLGGSCIAFSLLVRWTTWRTQPAVTEPVCLADASLGRGLVLGAMPIIFAFYVSYVLQLWWYSAATPWILPSVRPF